MIRRPPRSTLFPYTTLFRSQSPALTVIVQNGVPRIQATALLADGKFVGLMRSGFPLRLHYRLELWRARPGRVGQVVTDFPLGALGRPPPPAPDLLLLRGGSQRGAPSRK